MKIGILGTGHVGRAHAEKLIELGHDVVIGTRNVNKTLSKTEINSDGDIPFSEWLKNNESVKISTFIEAAAGGEVIFNALKGDVSLSVLSTLGRELEGRILVDIANPLDFRNGMPASLFVCNTDSLGEQIQKALPKTKVVKTFNTINAYLQVNPRQLSNGDHNLFLSGDDEEAKMKVYEIAKSYGWKEILNLGGIESARGTEMMLPIWLLLWNSLRNSMFNFKVVKK